MQRLRLVQLPVPPPAALAATGNVPLAAGALGVAARVHGLHQWLSLDVLQPQETDVLGDTLLADRLAQGEPEFVGFSLYLWNSERSLHLAREVKRRSPRTRALIGGPEVSSDNAHLLQQRGFDFAIAGEAEESFARLMLALKDGGDGAGLPGVAVRRPLGLSPFGVSGETPQAGFALASYPSPYLEGLVPVDPQRSTYVETVRGCKSHCTFCFYPRSSSVLRTLEVADAGRLVGSLRDRGAREVVFLDPTFNHRPQFEELLAELALQNANKSLTFFGEVRAEGLTAGHAKALKAAGFDRLEIGLQSVNPGTLKQVRRGGSAKKVAEAARLLHDAGITLLVDLIIGLPGDTPADVAHGVDFLLENGLGDEAQVFPLSLLPGTAMRASAEADGIEFDPAPPYRVRRTRGFTPEQLRAALDDAEERLDRRLDEEPRPHLAEAWSASDGSPRPLAPDVFTLDLDEATAGDRLAAAAPGAQHSALWLVSRGLWERRDGVQAAIDARLRVDPFATLDVVLRPLGTFPLDLLDRIRAQLAAAVPSYVSRALAHRGEDAQRRISVVLGEGLPFAQEWVEAVRDLVPVFCEQRLRAAAKVAEELGARLPGARIIGPLDDAGALERLSREAAVASVTFADRAQEARWTRGELGYSDTDR
jgi:Radical SAM superfamily/B12 binding domain